MNKPSRSRCSVCHQPITWGLLPGGKWVPLEERPHGIEILLRGRYIVTCSYRDWDSFPDDLKEAIAPGELSAWKDAIDGPRYAQHDAECRRIAGTSKRLRVDADDFAAVLS